MPLNQVLLPALPFMGKLPADMQPGNRVRIRGVVNRPNGDCRIQLQTGDSLSPMDDVVLHLNILPSTREILSNSYCEGKWGQEERSANSPINFDDEFELIISAEAAGFCIDINDSSFAKFNYRCPVQMARYIFITGGCVIRAVNFANWNSVPKVISVLPSAPVFSQAASASAPPMAFHFPAWPHGNMQYFAPSPPLYPQSGQATFFNPAMFIQQPLLMNLPTAIPKNFDSGATMQYKILVTVLWKICCILFKALKLIALALAGGFGVYLLSKRLRL
ncbi:galectin-4-like [Topomyia yanbarensis]|uniref:galectin-4-like n=1 Tax=Topomyia yanbarensis TaxID=2498891 RepID=UPI00273BE6E3|nr:galectin-4-like [Topomyia yanbarensis]